MGTAWGEFAEIVLLRLARCLSLVVDKLFLAVLGVSVSRGVARVSPAPYGSLDADCRFPDVKNGSLHPDCRFCSRNRGQAAVTSRGTVTETSGWSRMVIW